MMNETIQCATSPEDLLSVREMCQEYAHALGVDLETQNLAQELGELPGKYASPFGCLLLAFVNGKPAGCVALKRLTEDTCEMKRLYVRPQYRRRGLGRRLLERLIQEARLIGYSNLRLDTLPEKMDRAVSLYCSMGFVAIPPYWNNTLPGVEYMELRLRNG
jgi:GNAT superfamily N-acetyltransferase